MIFLRPWLLLLILIPFLFKLFKEQAGAESPWKKVIDEKLLPYLLIKGSNATTKQRRFFKILLWTLFSIALAGPAWDKTDVPAHTYQPGTIIVLELGSTMTGENLKKAQQKIYDILDLLKGEQVGLVLYDRYGYTAGPLTFETDIIRNMVPYLDASVLPEKRSNPIAGFEQADRLFQNANVKEGRILFLTSGAYWNDNLATAVQKYPHKIGILGIGPAEPHPLPRATGGFIMDSNGQPLMVYFDPKKMKQVGAFEVMTPDDTDVQNLIDSTVPASTETERLTNQNITIWRDRGGILVALLLPFFALLFRKSILVLFILCLIRPAEASLWLRPDQEIYRQQMNGVKFYRQAEYSYAEKMFNRGKDVEALYNKGNALAFQQKIQEAIDTYKAALKIDPKHEDARYNKEYLEKKQQQKNPEQNPPDPKNNPEQQNPQQNQQQENQQNNPEQNPPDPRHNPEQQNPQQNQQQDNQQNNPEQNPPDPQHNPERQNPQQNQQQPPESNPDRQDPQQANPPPPEGNPEQQNDPENNPDQPQTPPPPESEASAESESEPLFDQESEKVLNKLPSDEDNVLRYRIRQQYKRYIRN